MLHRTVLAHAASGVSWRSPWVCETPDRAPRPPTQPCKGQGEIGLRAWSTHLPQLLLQDSQSCCLPHAKLILLLPLRRALHVDRHTDSPTQPQPHMGSAHGCGGAALQQTSHHLRSKAWAQGCVIGNPPRADTCHGFHLRHNCREGRGEPARPRHHSAPRSRRCLTQAQGARPWAGARWLPCPAQRQALGHSGCLYGAASPAVPSSGDGWVQTGKESHQNPRDPAVQHRQRTQPEEPAALGVRHHRSKPALD